MTGQADDRDLLAAVPAVRDDLAPYVALVRAGFDVGFLDSAALRDLGRRMALLGANMVRLADRLDRDLPIPAPDQALEER